MRSTAVLALVASFFVLSVVAQTTTPLVPNGSGVAGASLTSVGPTTLDDASNCGQIEFDIFNLASTGQPSRDLFQYLTPNGANLNGVNFASTTPYLLTLANTSFPGGVALEIILSPQQGSFVSATQINGPFNASIDTISVQLNSQYTITQTFNRSGNNFTFNAVAFPAITSGFVLSNFTVSIVQVFPAQDGLNTNSTCATAYVLDVVGATAVRGDPQFVGLRGQSYQIHGIDGAVYNLISDKSYQLNSRFGFLTGPRPCPRMPSTGRASAACWSHPGSYLVELGLVAGNERVFIKAGSAVHGFDSVTVNDKQLAIGESTLTAARNTTHELTLTFGAWSIEVENSDSFVNIRSIHVDRSQWSKLASHGLLGQTWSSKKYSGQVSAIEGDVEDYLVEENTVFGTGFVYNKFENTL